MLLQIVEVLIGLSAVYLIFSTMASALAELIESCWRKRGKLLSDGIREMLQACAPKPEADLKKRLVDDALKAFYSSPPVAILFRGQVRVARQRLTVKGGRLPSYIPAAHFAAAVQHVADDDSKSAELRELFATLRSVALTVQASHPSLNSATKTLPAPNDAAPALMGFFDAAGERMSGWFKRHVQGILLIVGFGLAAAFNVDTLHVIRELSQNQQLRKEVVDQTLARMDDMALQLNPPIKDDEDKQQNTTEEIDKLLQERLQYIRKLGLPIGWEAARQKEDFYAWLLRVGGWFLTAIAISVGASFWFELLSQLVQLRNTLKYQEEKPAPSAAPPAT